MNPQALVSPTQQPLTKQDVAFLLGRQLPPAQMAGLLARAMAYNPDQPRDAHGRFGETQDDQSDALINSPEVLKDLRVPAVMYHVTTEAAAQAILRDGLKPGQPRASTLGASRGVYLTDDPSNISKGAGDVGGTVVLQVSTKGLPLRLDPEFFYYDHSAANAKAYVQAVNEGQESFALYSQKTIPASHITRLKTLAFNPDQPRDEHGRWGDGGDGGAFSIEENTALDKAIGVEVQKISAPLGYIAKSAIWAKEPARAAMKQKVEAEIAARLQTNDTLTTGPHVLAKTVVNDWAITSGDHNLFAVRGQHAVAEEFGLSDAATDHLGPSSQMEHPDITSHDLKAYARAEYENTQQWFKDRGITHVSVYRGMQKVKMAEGEQTVTMQPASSWTTDRKTASIFAGGRYGETPPIMEARVPVSRVLSTAVTGRGALIEAEVVLLGGPMKVRVRR